MLLKQHQQRQMLQIQTRKLRPHEKLLKKAKKDLRALRH